MNKRGTGAIFFLTSAILMGAQYIAGAIYASGTNPMSRENFKQFMDYTGPFLPAMALIMVATGAFFIITSTLDESKELKAKKALAEKAEKEAK